MVPASMPELALPKYVVDAMMLGYKAIDFGIATLRKG
jgi:hypothetical protein